MGQSPIRVQPGSYKARRIALVHDYLVATRGGERVFQQICEAFPEGDIYTLIYDRRRMPALFQERGVTSSFIQWLPFSVHYRRLCLPLYPIAARNFDLSGYDVVVASSTAWAHGVTVGSRTRLICYCHSPFRYIWSHYDTLVRGRLPVLKGIADRLRQQMRRWDLESAARVDQYIASSKVVQQRIKSYYGKDSLVVAPPIDLEQFRPVKRPSGDYFLVVSALMKYKRVDIAVEAFNALGMRLKVVGDGEEAGSLKRIAGPTIEFLGRVPDSELPNLYANCRAFIFTAEEDFGITPIEAMACGRPVVAFGAGGATETVVPGTTGVFFSSQTADALVEIVRTTNFESFDTIAIRSRAEQFGAPAFHESIRAIVNRLDEHDPPREVEFQ